MLPGGRDFLYTVDDPQLGSLRARIATTGGNDPGVEVVQADSRVQYTGFAPLRWRVSGLLACRNAARAAVRSRRTPCHRGAQGHRPPRPFLWFLPAPPTFRFRGAACLLTSPISTARSSSGWTGRANGFPLPAPLTINASFVRLSPDGRWLAAVPFDIERGVSEIWLYDAVSGAGRKTVFGPGIRTLPGVVAGLPPPGPSHRKP